MVSVADPEELHGIWSRSASLQGVVSSRKVRRPLRLRYLKSG